ncbi:Alpha/beta hydrolase [Pseudomonas brassicacearum]
MGWPLNLSVIWRQAPRFFKGLTGYTYSEGTGPLEKSAALYQKDHSATTADVICLRGESSTNRPGRRGQRLAQPLTARRCMQVFFTGGDF